MATVVSARYVWVCAGVVGRGNHAGASNGPRIRPDFTSAAISSAINSQCVSM